MSEDTVRVAVRIRPLVRTEIEKGCQTCLTVIPGESQIQVRGTEKAFTFNYVFAPEIEQDSFYKTAIQDMVKNVFQGYNVTILAYGQTGSGKTHSMGTNYAHGEQPGVIPRAVQDIFAIINLKQDWIFNVTVSFMELYQEQLYDLLSKKQRNQCIVDIREDSKGVKVAGLTEVNVTNAEETLQCLTQGSLGRATGATAMNACSSRSHAIFTITIYQQKRDDPNTATTAKFHLVDLAGSERSKKTQATGERFKEGVNINKGLLALGNVISQLGEGGSHSYIGYRDSKLTRLLQDSLGGNSMTLMIACVSPADYNLDETISTLRYADRARRIKNKPIVNQDPGIAEINRLHKTIQELRVALLDTGHGGSCPPEHNELQEKNRLLQKRVRDLASKLNENLLEVVHMHEQAELAEQARERNKAQLTAVLHEFEDLSSLNVCAICTDLCNKIETIRMKLLDLQKDDAKNAEELRCHDICGSAGSSSSGIVEEKPHTSGSEDEFDKSTDLDEKQEEHTLQQAERNNEVQNINRELALKEDLISKLLKNSSHLADYTKELQEMEQEIKSLQAEKEELLQALQSVKANNASSKIAETRRKKVQELEKKITELTRKCVEQNKAIKMKEKSDQQIKNLTTEIQSLKQIRVKLVRQMRSEAERFGKWRQERERELSKLKDQDRKRQNQMARLESLYNKQQNVMKRKIEEATSINKRLKEA
ncbi:chromosome-associated kinesin KIF4 [Orussus abietinus]|uniref:chromosome-associated kinesin KIF4 n=1 Tax=Orussus abietinus TaxID=222816 RepID=UPI000C715C5E|nr:chromosome-associated kinesin KIF4 [Orussus abietinus]XP_023288015.1 chromosome-associated kinesin KIF4 [Orussus abietinus]